MIGTVNVCLRTVDISTNDYPFYIKKKKDINYNQRLILDLTVNFLELLTHAYIRMGIKQIAIFIWLFTFVLSLRLINTRITSVIENIEDSSQFHIY